MNFELIKNSKSARLSISIKSDGNIVVTAPKLIPNFMINAFLAKNEKWIKTQQEKIKNKLKFIDQDSIYIFGKKYLIKIENTISPSKIILRGEDLVLKIHNLPANFKFDPQQPPAVLARFLKNTAQHYITERTSTLAKKMNLAYKKISFKTQKTRWGSCSSTKNLNFNLKLIHFSTQVIDYVITHELAHLEQMNHSAKFWLLVEKYQPEYRLHRGWLKRHGSTID